MESGSDPELEAAIDHARATLPEFVTRVADPNLAYSLVALKVRFSLPDESTRDIWLDEAAYVNGEFSGNMGDDLPTLHLAFDDRLVINQADIIDWMIVENHKLVGGFTIRLACLRMTPEEQKRFLESLGYSLE